MTTKLLVVDDDMMIRQYLSDAAQQLGYQVLTASDTESFRRTFKEEQPDIVLLDLMMPGTDGVEQLKFLAAMQCKVPVVLMSGLDGRAIHAAHRLGSAHGLRIVGGLEKPFDLNSLEQMLGHFSQERYAISKANLVDALDRNELRLHYQPQVKASSGKPCGVEALLRWEHPDYGLLLPTYFLDLAEKTGFITEITKWVCASTAAQLAQWTPSEPALSMSINLSIRDLETPDFPCWVESAVREQGLDPASFVLEVTEREAASDAKEFMEVLTRLRLKGFQLSIDDFGTGYSSLAMLQCAPFTELKIDKYFVMESERERDADVIVRSVLNLGHTLGLRVVAEGVEEPSTHERMRNIGVDVIQGFHTARPMTADACSRWLSEPHTKVASA